MRSGAAVVLVFSAALAAAQDVASWQQQLTASEVAVRREAAYQLGKSGAAAQPALPALIKALDDPDKQVWAFSISAIANLGPAAADAIPALLDTFNSRKGRGGRERDRRQSLTRAAFALSRIGPGAIPPLIAALGSGENLARQGAALALGGMGGAAAEATPALIANLGNEDVEVQRETIDALTAIGAPAVKPLANALTAPAARTRAGAAAALAQIGPAAGEAAPTLLKLATSETDPLVRAALLPALPRVGVPAEPAIALLLKGIVADDESVGHAAINALASWRAVRAQAVPPLVALLKNSAPAVQERVARALGRFGPDASAAVPALLEAAQRPETASVAAAALAEIGPVALPQLLAALQHAGANSGALITLLRGFGEAAVPALLEALKQPEAPIRAAAARALGEMGVEAKPAIGPLLARAADADSATRAAALRALLAVQAEAPQLTPLLEKALADKNLEVRRAGAAGLVARGAVASVGLPVLLELLTDENASGRRAAVEGLAALGAGAAPTVSALQSMLTEAALQAPIAVALGKIGAAAAPAVPALAELAAHGSPELRVAVLNAFAAIGRPAKDGLKFIYESLQPGEANVRGSALAALANVEPNDAKTLAILVPAVSDESGRVRRPAALALIRFGPAARAAGPALVAMVENENDRAAALDTLRSTGLQTLPELQRVLAVKDPAARVFACEQLALLGAEARPAAPKVKELLTSNAPAVQDAARAALAKIEPGS